MFPLLYRRFLRRLKSFAGTFQKKADVATFDVSLRDLHRFLFSRIDKGVDLPPSSLSDPISSKLNFKENKESEGKNWSPQVKKEGNSPLFRVEKTHLRRCWDQQLSLVC